MPSTPGAPRPRARRRRIPLVLLFAVVMLAFAAAACGGDGGGPDDPVVARVNGRDVRESSVALVRAEARLVGEPDDAAKALDEAIRRALVILEAERLGVTVAAAAVDDRAAAVTEQLGGEDALAAALEKAAMTPAQFRAGLETAVLLEELRAARYPDLESTVAEARRYYDRHLRDLFTRPAAVDLGAIFVRNEGIAGNAMKRLKAGRPFEEVSRQFSIDPELKDNAGRLGWVDPRSLPGQLGAEVADLPAGKVSEPVAGGGGVWIFKAFRRRDAETVPFAEARDELVDQLTTRKRGRALERWLDEAVAGADIERP